ncbi:MAG: ATP-binding cassette domain-containing protein [Holosporales bacterium]|jgi:putative ABC transport system ATP-binding protein|nr:ATP-binding cassette domain-containing protein [Holosporales bacterium]
MLKLINVSVRETLKNLSLEVQKGEFVLIVGANGTGKTTLFNAISGAVGLKNGKVVLNGKDLTNSPPYKRAKLISRVLQEPSLGTIADMTILENMGLAYMRKKYKKISRKVVDYFKEKLNMLGMGLENRLTEYVKNLSGGQKQLLSLAMATIDDYELLLLDEITAALDPQTSETVMNIAQKIISQEKKTCLLITHNVKHMDTFGNRVLEMKNGKLVERQSVSV